MGGEFNNLVPGKRRLRIWPAVVLVLCALSLAQLVGWHGRISREQIVATTEARAYERTTRLHLEQLLSQFKDLESGSRGFLLTGDPDYLAPYHGAQATIPGLLDGIKARNPQLPAGTSWSELDQLVARRMELAARVVALRAGRGEAARREISLLDMGKATMDRIRERFARIDVAKDAHIADLNQRVDATRQRAERTSWIGSSAAFLLIVLAGWLVLRERRQRIVLEQALRDANLSLEVRVAERTAALEAARQQLAGFAAEQNRAIEAERRALSREVHDQIGQVFTAVKLIVGSVPRASFPPGQAEALDQALVMGIASTRRVTAVLRPPLLDDLGLGAALRHYAESLAHSAGLAVTIRVDDEDCLDEAARLVLFRITQEAMTNVVRHAGAARVDIAGRREGADYAFAVTDDGRGLDSAASRPGAIGLIGMRERAALLGGECAIVSAPGGGTRVTVRVPSPNNVNGESCDNPDHENPAG